MLDSLGNSNQLDKFFTLKYVRKHKKTGEKLFRITDLQQHHIDTVEGIKQYCIKIKFNIHKFRIIDENGDYAWMLF